jgi:hypothetical protein
MLFYSAVSINYSFNERLILQSLQFITSIMHSSSGSSPRLPFLAFKLHMCIAIASG